jgi:hypothetical protein
MTNQRVVLQSFQNPRRLAPGPELLQGLTTRGARQMRGVIFSSFEF